MQALLRYPRAERRAVAQEWARRSQAVQAERRLQRGPDAETLRWRAAQDARGQIIREGVTYFGSGRVVPWCVRRSIAGRVNQFDAVAGGNVVIAASWRHIARRFRLSRRT